MTVLRIIVLVLAVLGVGGVLLSVLRTVVLPRAVPARLARIVFLSVRLVLVARLRLSRRRDYAIRDRTFALQAPLGLFAQLATWGILVMLLFAAIFWSLSGRGLTGPAVARAIELSGSSMLTLGTEHPAGLGGHLLAFADAGVGLTLLALVVTYLPSLYSAFSRREAMITRLVVRAGEFPTGPRLLSSMWQMGRFEHVEDAWNSWESWFIELGESHTTFPQLGFFRSPHPSNHWVLAAETILDGAGLYLTSCELNVGSRAELLTRAGVSSLFQIADFLGVPHEPPADERELVLTRPQFDKALQEMTASGIPVVADRDAAWRRFEQHRKQYEPLITVLGRMSDSPRSDWSSWSDDSPRHSPPLFRIHRPAARTS